jgi:hypothetical protein
LRVGKRELKTMELGWPSRFRRIATIILAIAVIMILWGGIAIVAGLPQSGVWQREPPLGFVLISIATAILAFTCRTWAKWFFGFSLFTSLKLVLILVFGYYWTGPVSRLLAFGGLVLFVFTIVLTYEFVSRKPETKVEVAALVGAVIGISSMAVSNSLWPLLIAVVLLAAARLLGRPINKGPSCCDGPITFK